MVTGGSSGSSRVQTSSNVTAASDHLYLAAITSKSYKTVTSVTGLGLTWSEVLTQCGGRNQTGVTVWKAQGTPSGPGPVSATLSGSANNAAIAVSRYSGVALSNPIGNTVSDNSNGIGGGCSGGVDTDAYSFSLTTTASDSLVYGAISMRNKTHTPGAGYTERVAFVQGSGGGTASVAVMERATNSPSSTIIDGGFSSSVDYGVIGIEIKPVGNNNTAPDVTNPGNQTGTVNTAITSLQINATDSDNGDILTFSDNGNSLPAGLSISSSGLITGTPITVSNYNVTINISDNTDITPTSFDWNISPATNNNSAPTITTIGAQTATSGTSKTINVTATDSDSSDTLSFSLGSGPSFVSLTDNGNRTATITVGAGSTVGNHNITVNVSDGNNGNDSGSFVLTVSSTGSSSCGPLTQEAEAGILSGDFEISDNSSASGGQIVEVPADPSYYTQQGVTEHYVEHCFNVTQVGTYRIVGTAKGSGSNDNSFRVTMNDQPSDGHAWSYTHSNGFVTEEISGGNGSGDVEEFFLNTGDNTVRFYLREDGAQLDKISLVLQGSGNTVPNVTNPGNQTGTVNTAITPLQINATDDDGDILTFSESGNSLPAGLSISSSGLVMGTPTTASNYNVTINVSDNDNTTPTSFDWNINPAGGGGSCGPLTQEAETGTLSGAFGLVADSAASGGQYVEVPADTTSTGSAPSSNYAEYCFNVTQAGTYRIEGTARASNSSYNSFRVTVNDNPSSGHAWAFSHGNGFVTEEIAGGNGSGSPEDFSLNAGDNTVRFYLREDGAQLDKVRLVLQGGGNTAPSVTISNPNNGTNVTQGSNITLTATANDTEDGSLTNTISWSSNHDGSLGTGGSVSLSNLSANTHTITASVTDSGGLSGNSTISLTVTVTTTGGSTVTDIIVDNSDNNTHTTGTWLNSSTTPTHDGSNSVYSNTNGSFRWTPNIITAGEYTVYAWWTYYASRPSAASYTLQHNGGSSVVTKAQNDQSLGGQWVELGTYTFAAGSAGYVELTSNTSGNFSADAIKLVHGGGSRPSSSNADPVISTIGTQTATVGSSKTINVSASDSDSGDTLSFILESAPSFVSLTDNGNRTATLAVSSNSTSGHHNIVVSVRDANGSSDSESVVLTVSGQIAANLVDWQVVGTNDFDGDGKFDTLLHNFSTGEVWMYLMDAAQVSTSAHVTNVGANWRVAGTGDFNGDGKADVLWRETITHKTRVYLMNGTTVSADQAVSNATELPEWQIRGVDDFDGDGKADILWRNINTERSWMYLMNGSTIVSQGIVADHGPNWRIKGTGDFNGDGKADILFRNTVSDKNIIFLMNGNSILQQSAELTFAALVWEVRGVADFNGDGKADILWRHKTTGENRIYMMNSFTVTSNQSVNTEADLAWKIVGVGDFNGDGKSDIYWRYDTDGQHRLYLMNGASINASVLIDQTLPQQTLTVSVSTLSFTLDEGTTGTQSIFFTSTSNDGVSSLPDLISLEGWLSSTNGRFSNGAKITVDTTGLALGTYTSDVIAILANHTTATIRVTLEVTQASGLGPGPVLVFVENDCPTEPDVAFPTPLTP